jgi:hypothetical protein
MGPFGISLPMRAIFVISFGMFLIASLFGLADPRGSAAATPLDGKEYTSHLPEFPCSEASGHPACQLAVAGSPDHSALLASAGMTLFEIMPVSASGRSIPPRTPPPRHRS